MATALRRQLERAERVIHPAASRVIPCAWHALAEIEPRVHVAPADVFPGSCPECGGDMDFNMTGATPRERELSAEFYFRGHTLDTLTASRRSLAAMVWLSRRGETITASPGEVYKRALIDEHNRRMGEKWAAHLEAVSDETLEVWRDLAERDLDDARPSPSDAELEAIIWPEGA
jgi:hypothetical protein